MSGTYFVVNHVSDPNKIDGLVESYQMIPVQYDDGNGGIVNGFKRLNFVHWPSVPTPFVHEEWSEELTFTNIYTPIIDDQDDEEDEEEEDYSDDEEADFDAEEEEEQIQV